MHRSSFSRHDSFFSSLSQVEKRLESEKEAEEVEPSSSFPSSSSSPLFLLSNDPEPIHHEATANAGSSEPPLDFLSNSPTNTQFQQQQQQQQQAPDDDGDDHQVEDDIDHLVSLLGLSLPPHQNDDDSSCDCSCSQGGGGGGFFRKVVGVKGPRCGKEMERLDGWIDTLYPSSSQSKSKSKSKREPARLAHLLLGKAAALALNDGGGDGFGAVGFPATVHDFLDHDPPATGETRVE